MGTAFRADATFAEREAQLYDGNASLSLACEDWAFEDWACKDWACEDWA